MRILALGINRSKIKGLEQGCENWKSQKSESDKKINYALGKITQGDYEITDIMNVKKSISEIKKLSFEEIKKYCEENRLELLKVINNFRPELILLLFKSTYPLTKILTEFMNNLKKENKNFPKMINVYHPRYISRYNKNKMTEEQYTRHIKEEIMKG